MLPGLIWSFGRPSDFLLSSSSPLASRASFALKPSSVSSMILLEEISSFASPAMRISASGAARP